MEHLQFFLRFISVFFVAYAFLYLIQWMAAMIAAFQRLSRCEENQQLACRLYPVSALQEQSVSVIIPAYNEEACIVRTVEGLLRAEYPTLEILVVDDGSRDSTARRMIEAFHLRETKLSPHDQALPTQRVRTCYTARVKGRRVTLLCKDNGGKGDALNCGFSYASSPYCLVVDADTVVRPGAIRLMVSRFLVDPSTIVCAGAVGTRMRSREDYEALGLFQKMLVLFQRMEYYRTFYIHRVFFDRLNANIIVSGAFALFDRDTLIQAGGYKTDTIGEDMELTMRLHAFCMSQHQTYRIAYVPEARCDTQLPFHLVDYYRQRRRWHIGLAQSLHQHLYMIGQHYYGWVGVLSVLFMTIYELLSPIIEVAGLVFLLLAAWAGNLGLGSAIAISVAYFLFSLLTQSLLLSALRGYRIERIGLREHGKLIAVAATEVFLFHPINVFIKLATLFTYRRYRATWHHIRRVDDDGENA